MTAKRFRLNGFVDIGNDMQYKKKMRARDQNGKKNGVRLAFVCVALVFVTSSCSINRFAVRAAANALSGDGTSGAFMGDNDPDLVGDALPFVLKLYDVLIEQDPANAGLLLAAGSGYISYANAFLQTPAEMLGYEYFERAEYMRARAKNLYLRGRDMVLSGLDIRRPAFRDALADPSSPLEMMRTTDVPYLYWAAAGWVGAYSVDPFDLEIGFTVPEAGRLMARAYELDPDFNDGAISEFYISYYAGLPDGLGGSRVKARAAFERAVAATGGESAGPYVALAVGVSVPEQNIDEFRDLLASALAVDPDANPNLRLLNTLNRRRAQWLLAHEDDFFLLFDDDWEDLDDSDDWDDRDR